MKSFISGKHVPVLLVCLCMVMPLMVGCDESGGGDPGAAFSSGLNNVPPPTFTDGGTSDVPVGTTPEPGTFLLMGLGMAGLAAVRRLRRKK